MVRRANHTVGEWAAMRPMSLSATPVCALRAFGGWCAERTIRQIENERGERRYTVRIYPAVFPLSTNSETPEYWQAARQ